MKHARLPLACVIFLALLLTPRGASGQGGCVTLFDQPDFKGLDLRICGDTPDMRAHRHPTKAYWNSNVKSAQLEAGVTITFFEHAYFNKNGADPGKALVATSDVASFAQFNKGLGPSSFKFGTHPNPGGSTSKAAGMKITGRTVNASVVGQIVAGTPLAQYVSVIMNSGSINPAFALAIWTHESSLITAGASVGNNNPGNIQCHGAYACNGRWTKYPDLATGIREWYGVMNRVYLAKGLDTVEQVMPVYAPPSENNTDAYITQVKDLMRKWSEESGTPISNDAGGDDGAGDEEGGGFSPIDLGGSLSELLFGDGMIDTWVYRPADKYIISTYRGWASGGWQGMSGLLWVTLIMEQFRVSLATGGLRGLIDLIAAQMLGVSEAALLLGWLLAMAGLALIAFTRIRVISVQRVIVAALLLPSLYLWAGAVFQGADHLRANLGSLVYDASWAVADPYFKSLIGEQTGADLPFSDPVPFDPSVTTTHRGIDVAAALVDATVVDLRNPGAGEASDLPDAFATKFYPQSDDDLENASAEQRRTARDLAWRGVLRMGTGFVPGIFAFLESLINLMWSVAFGCLAVTLLIVAPFGWLEPVRNLLVSLFWQTLSLFVASIGVALLMATLMTGVFNVAATHNALALVGACGVVGLVFVAILVKTGRLVVSAGVGVLGILSGGAVDDRSLRDSAQRMREGFDTTCAGAGAVIGASADTVRNAAGVSAAYTVARPGTSAFYAAGYAVPAFAHAGALARAMRRDLPADLAAGATTRSTAGRRDPLAPTAVSAIDRFADARAKQQKASTPIPPATTTSPAPQPQPSGGPYYGHTIRMQQTTPQGGQNP